MLWLQCNADQCLSVYPPPDYLGVMNLSLRSLLIIPFILQVIGITSIVGYFSYRSGQRAVADLAAQLMHKTGEHVSLKLDHFLSEAHQANQLHITALESGVIDLQDLDQLHRYLIQQIPHFPEATTFLFGSPAGDFRLIHRVSPQEFEDGVTRLRDDDLPFEAGIATPTNPDQVDVYSINEAGDLIQRVEITQNIDVRDRPWYTLATHKRQPGWSAPFQIGASNLLGLNAYVPILDDTQTLQGVFSVNISLNQLSAFLETLAIGKTGQVFILDTNGLLIANSAGEATYRTSVKAYSGNVTTTGGTFQQLTAADSSNSLIGAGSQAIQDSLELEQGHLTEPTLLTFTLGGIPHFLYVIPYRDNYGLEWLIATVVPQGDFTSEIQANLRRTVLLCGLALIGSIGFSTWIVRRLTQPLKHLNQVTQTYATARELPETTVSGIREIDRLWQAFTQMMIELDTQQRQADAFHSTYQKKLEQKVTAQTTALSKTAAKLKEAQRIAQMGSWELDVATRKITWSEGLFIIFGLDPNQPEPTYEDLLSRLVPPDGEILHQALDATIAHGNPFKLEHRILHPDGTLHYLSSRGEAIYNDQGQVIRLAGTSADISDRKQIETTLRRYERIVSATVDGISLIDRHYIYQIVNQTYLNRTGKALDEIVGHSVSDLHGEAIFRSQIQPKLVQCLTGQIIQYEDWFDYAGLGARFVSVTYAPYREVDGTISGVIVSTRDITERKQTEDAIQRQKEQLRLLTDALPVFISYEDTEQRYRFVNKNYETYFGKTREEIYGLHVRELIGEANYAVAQPWIERVLTGETVSYELTPQPNHQEQHLAVTLIPDLDANQQVRGFYNLIIDISDRKQIEIELQRAKDAAEAANQAKSRFIANISHELRSPLNAILGLARILKDEEVYLPTEHQEHAKIIEQSGEHLLNIINQVLDLAKIESDQVTLASNSFDLWHLLSNLRDLFAVKATAKGITFVIEQDRDLPQFVCTDKLKLQQVLINLLDNAFKFTEQGQIILAAKPLPHNTDHPPQLQFAVADTGPGIAPEEQGMLFQPFTQTQAGQTAQSGTGLGLAISQEFVKLMGGNLTINSQVGQGSVFQFNITVASSSAHLTSSPRHQRRVVGLKSAPANDRLLVVDDSPINRRILIRMLSVLNLDLQQAKNGQEAVKLWESWRPNGVLMDLRMPVMNGYDAAQNIRQQESQSPSHAHTVIIAVSATLPEFSHQQSHLSDSDFDGYILKPFKPDDIFGALHNLLGLQYRYVDE